MTTERVYDIKVNGADSMNELKSAVSELTEKLKSLDQTSKEYLETLKQLTDYQQKLADAMGGISDSAEKTDNSLNGIKETVDSVADSISSLGEDVINSFAEGLAQGMAEAATETAQMGESMDNGVNSVKGLKQEISDLRDKLVTLDKGTDEYKETVQQLINDQVKLKEVMNAGKNETQAAEGSYNALTQRMSALKQVWKETTDEATRNEIGRQIAEINTQLKGMDASIGNFQRNVGNYKSALDGLDASFVNWKQELRECKEALQQLDPSTQEYADTLARASELTHQMADQQEMIKYSSTDLGDQLSNINGIASNLAAGYSAVNAAMGLFGEENEEVQQAMLKVQQAMALVQGLQGIDGFIKRTKGLSQSMGLVTKATQANTVATKASAAAARQDAAAKGVEAAATAAAVPAQLSLNAAMKANPIGFIIGLIATLVTAMVLLKDKIMEMIGSNKEMSAAFDKVKAVLSGFGNVIKKSIINPIKMAIIPIKTLAKVMIDLFNGDWSKIGDDIKEGFTEMKDNVVDTINVVGAFKEGYDKKVAEQNEAARKAEAAAREKELDNIIKDNEAKYGSDWKYTEEAKKLYDEMFQKRMEQYGKDSDEYKQAVRDKWAYDREFADKEQEAKDKENEAQKKKDEQAAKEAAQRRAKQLSDFQSAFKKYLPSGVIIEFDERTTIKKWKEGLGEFKKYIKKEYADLYSQIDFDKMWNDVLADFGKLQTTDIRAKIETSIKQTKDFIETQINEMDLFYKGKEVSKGLLVPDDLVDNWEFTFGKMSDLIEVSLLKVRGAQKSMKKEYEELFSFIENETERTIAINKALVNDSSYQAMVLEEKKLMNQREQLELQNIKKLSEYKKMGYEKDEEAEKTYYSNRLKSTELWYNQEEALIAKRQQMYMGGNEIEALKRQEEYENNYFNTTMEMYQKLRDRYNEMSNDMTLTAEERKNAEIEAARVTGQIIEEEMNHQTQLLKIQKDNMKAWQNAVKDAVSGVADILGTLGDSWSSLIELEKTEIAQQLENGEINEEEAKRREEANKESFENLKKIQIAQAIINTLAASVSAYQSMASIPYVGPVLGAAAAAAALVAGYAQVRQIQATNYESGSSSVGGGGAGSTNFQLPSVLELEPNMGRNTTDQSNIDELNNAGNGRGKGESAIRAYVVESEVSASQELANKRSQEVTF